MKKSEENKDPWKPNRIEWVIIAGIVFVTCAILFGVLRGEGVQREGDMAEEIEEPKKVEAPVEKDIENIQNTQDFTADATLKIITSILPFMFIGMIIFTVFGAFSRRGGQY